MICILFLLELPTCRQTKGTLKSKMLQVLRVDSLLVDRLLVDRLRGNAGTAVSTNDIDTNDIDTNDIDTNDIDPNDSLYRPGFPQVLESWKSPGI